MARIKQVSVGVNEKPSRLVASVPAEVLADIDDALADFHRSEGKRASVSAFVEVALRELLGRSDVTSVLRRYGAKAKRTVEE